jgi:hypothetical protein
MKARHDGKIVLTPQESIEDPLDHTIALIVETTR